ncbi:putative phage Mu protein gp47-like protein [Desulfosporosinus acidiphilus SJ4]|uniref:Putative phage Mu protein gp47-like protein n=1 Tax=Desulfosporosinus acidiphilus (strain DSM 22704 / JCM 16185 / SJ4) TaxID=646529 RepID=I4D3G8_DESAJ|nr:baseplate J/gp47 family protein [Desulfosporosinus acidiphilus]AFM40342.1 putative phage Mu protein gp47-like protein [Desulfosporosinus acidiphilus SJ4]
MYSETSNVILSRMLSNVSSDVDKSEGSFIYDATSPVAIEIAQQEANLDQVAKKFDITTLSGDELAMRIYQRTGISRNPATYATADVTITGNGMINTGDLVQTPGGVQFKSTQQQTISGSASVHVEALIAGSTGMVPANQITQFPVAIAGLVSVTNSNPTQDGFDAESDSALLQRYYDYIQTPATGGNIAQFINLMKDFTGVGDVKFYPTWNGNNTVKLVIIDVNKLPPSSDLVAAAQAYMDPGAQGLGLGAAPFGAFTTVEGAFASTITINFTAVKDSDYTDEQRLANVQANLTAYLQAIAFVDSTVSYAKIGSAILSSQGILDYTNLTVNGGISNVPLSYTSALTETPVLGVVTIA